MFLPSAMFSCETKRTPFYKEGGGKVAYLEHHELACEENQAVSYFKLERSNGRYRYVYKCCTTQLPCAQVNVVENSYTDANDAYYLDRQNDDFSSKYINRFKLSTLGSKLRYTYSCYHGMWKKIVTTSRTQLLTVAAEMQFILIDKKYLVKIFTL